ncbi:MAG: reverse transcriptase N-terminal domain-containing protein [Candidatus Sulfotelmatobacter sp.]|jgi:RNA-directed DNA polymerase
MTTAQAVGAVSSEAKEWYAIDWPTIHRNVRRLQVRIAQATKEGRWGKVRALQCLLTHSYTGKILAVRRVTENSGKRTPGVDQEIWDTPEKKTQAVQGVSTLLCKRPGLGFGDGCAREGGNFPFPRSAILEKVGSS